MPRYCNVLLPALHALALAVTCAITLLIPSHVQADEHKSTYNNARQPVTADADADITRILQSDANGNDNTGEEKPNIILILADDVGTGDIPVYWNSSAVDMPNLNRLASMGVTFKDAHSSPICAPSRYMLLSGNYAHRGFRPNGSWGFYENKNQFRDHQKSIAEVLRDVGYHTSMFGKWHLGAKAPPSGFHATPNTWKYYRMLTDQSVDWSLPLIEGPKDIGFQDSYITIGGIQSPPYAFFRNDVLDVPSYSNENGVLNKTDIRYWERGSYHMEHGKSKIGKHPGDGIANWDSSAYNMILVNETEKFIENHLKTTTTRSDGLPRQPFFTYVALGAVHVPHSPPNHYIDGSPVRNVYPSRHLDMLLEVDKVVGSLVSMIEDKQLADNTIIIFTSDNGGLRFSASIEAGHQMSGPLRGEKGSIYEGGHRIPMIMRYDNKFPQGATRKKMVALNDVYATICELVGAKIPEGSAQDSISFADYIQSGQNNENRRNRLATWVNKDQRTKHEAIRFGKMKLIRNVPDSSVELYNLKQDPSEQNDLSNISGYQTLINKMLHTLKQLGPCPNDRKDKFLLEGWRNKKGCGWFRKGSPEVRCKRYNEGEEYCSSVCGHNRQMCEPLPSWWSWEKES